MSPTGAIIIGAIAAAVVVYGIDLIEWFRVDDPIGAVAVHGLCGIFGTWAVGLFATGEYADFKGLFYGGGTKQLWAQVWGNGLVVIVTAAVSWMLFAAVNATGTLRVSEDGELEGIDIHEHGSPAYHPESAFMGRGL